jgi:plasmid maintenance system antidote protein VapI
MEEIKNLIREKGIKQTWIAEKIGRKPEELSMWINGTRAMPYDIKVLILKVLR